MVVFTCNHCGESLQKPRVEKHYSFQCRRPKSLTCVDCFKDFKNEEYVVHTKCITEEERYSAKGSIPGGVVKKGEVKQESWTDMIKSIVQTETNMKPSLRNLFNSISNYSNVPRKKVKFINFLKSSTGGRVNFDDIEAAWGLIEKHKNEQNKNNNQENGIKHKLNGDSEEAPANKKKKIEESENKNSEDDVFSFKGTILKILSAKGSISCKKLQKKVLNAYLKETGNAEYTEKTIKKYNKKLKKLPNVVISDDVVSLVTNEQ
ncbi:cell growth-regulating nucleolar protein [Tribolium madens]|uniref:cell growth-regulating nucleolar protein n=1 Tax=Tribolium madens TaxID=41895 RepID=UPI001CF7475F|nr:cell growth-regulating nucleolar protein [Tribolium madens]